MKGLVYLVGAGPGDPGLLTIKGLRAIQKADVIIYDRLANPALLKHARKNIEKIYVGKHPYQSTSSQQQINQLIVQKAKEGKTVVRLKGGDPFVFGRGGEEAEELVDHQIPFEIIPGITSALAVPAYTGIPVTHRELSSSFAVITGHEGFPKSNLEVDGSHKATTAETLVFLMGIQNLPTIVQNLIEDGWPETTPIALIRWGTTSRQEMLCGTLQDIVQKKKKNQFRPPAIIVVGQVVKLHQKLNWFTKKTLFGKRILVTRSQHQSHELSEKIMDLGGEPVEFPLIRLIPPRNDQPLKQALQRLSDFDWVIFTSVNGVQFFFDYLRQMKIDIRKLANAKLVAVGKKTADALIERGLLVEQIPQAYYAEALVEHLRPIVRAGEKVLIPRTNIARSLIPDQLSQMGCQVEAVDAYETVVDGQNAEQIVHQLKARKIDAITFTSSSTVRYFVQVVSELFVEWPEWIKDVKVACIGPVTAKTAQKYGFQVDVMAQTYTIEGLITALQKLRFDDRKEV